MFEKKLELYRSCQFFCDLSVICLSWLLAYYIRFNVPIVPVIKGIPPIKIYLYLLGPLLFLWIVVTKALGFYSKYHTSKTAEVKQVLKATTSCVVLLVFGTYFLRQYEFSRVVFFYFWLISSISLSIIKLLLRRALFHLRSQGWDLEKLLIVGAGELAREVAIRILHHPELGLKLEGYLSDKTELLGSNIHGVQVLGKLEDVAGIIKKYDIDIVIIALPLEAHEKLVKVCNMIDNEMVDIKIVPDLARFFSLRGGIEDLDGLPVINLRESPMYGWNRINKRILDIIISVISLILLSPIFLIIAILIKCTSKGPIFFVQERMGLDGRVFKMIKFRSMKVDAEKNTGPIWAVKGDPRCTKVGSFLRRYSLDELPQLINVLKGEMSLVGPRPERPEFIREFRNKIPKYMLRHKMKAGMTGWAQINGWRGNTDLEQRIKFDLYYIENWSILFDLKILVKTLWKGIVSPNAY